MSANNKLYIHDDIEKQLGEFIKLNKIPNILLYGGSGSGKKTLLNNFINNVYQGVNKKKDYIMYINCAYNKGIKFIRDELKFFSKTNIQKIKINDENVNTDYKTIIKSVILINADFLTIDAQSALRRSIELFSKTTRFFMIANNKDSLLDPIVSRFCNIYVPNPIIKNKSINLHEYTKYNFFKDIKIKNKTIIKRVFNKLNNNNVFLCSVELYNKGCSGIEILEFIKDYNSYNNIKKTLNIKNTTTDTDTYKKYIIEKSSIDNLLLYCYKIKSDIMNEKLFILFILNNYLMRHSLSLENIDIM